MSGEQNRQLSGSGGVIICLLLQNQIMKQFRGEIVRDEGCLMLETGTFVSVFFKTGINGSCFLEFFLALHCMIILHTTGPCVVSLRTWWWRAKRMMNNVGLNNVR